MSGIHIVPEGDGNLIVRELRQLMDNWSRGPIEASFSVNGHSYWWILEYGSGLFAEAPDGYIAPPQGVPPIPSGQGEWLITARGRGTSRVSRERRRKNKARYRKMLRIQFPDGLRFLKAVSVQGQGANRGWIRKAIRRFEEDVASMLAESELLEAGGGKFRVTREYLVERINFYLERLLEEVRRGVPLGMTDRKSEIRKGMHDAGHLRDAWSVELAR